MANTDSGVTIHMAASLDGFIARKDGRVDWLETSDEFAGGDTLDPGFAEAFLKTIDCYVMGSRTYETALNFEAKGLGWSYGDKPTFVLTRRELPRTRTSVEFLSGDLTEIVNGRLRPAFRTIWIAFPEGWCVTAVSVTTSEFPFGSRIWVSLPPPETRYSYSIPRWSLTTYPGGL